ncbi:MAG: hypothetical protein ACKO0Z_28090 [Betaproteobacteria bacterium]
MSDCDQVIIECGDIEVVTCCEQGLPGAPGLDGDGKPLLFGTGEPDSSLGVDGQNYIDTDTSTVYLREIGEWSAQYVLFNRYDFQGRGWLSGSGVPAFDSENGWNYYDTSTGNVYEATGPSTGTVWVLRFNIPRGVSEYVHTQASALAVWTVPHNLNKRPSVSVTSAGGVEWEGGEVLHLSLNTLQITFDQPEAGFARCV